MNRLFCGRVYGYYLCYHGFHGVLRKKNSEIPNHYEGPVHKTNQLFIVYTLAADFIDQWNRK